MIEYIGEGDKYKIGTGDRIHTIRENSREYNYSGQNSNGCVEYRYRAGCFYQMSFIIEVGGVGDEDTHT